MEIERRSYPREETDMKVSLMFDNREVPVSVRNLSGGGIFVQIMNGSAGMVSPSDVGRTVRLSMQGAFCLASSRATIVRCVDEADSKFVALAFNTGMP